MFTTALALLFVVKLFLKTNFYAPIVKQNSLCSFSRNTLDEITLTGYIEVKLNKRQNLRFSTSSGKKRKDAIVRTSGSIPRQGY